MPLTSAFVLIDKPVGITSFRSLSAIKKQFGTKRVGHAGTLDQAASGLIVAAVGKCTRLLPYIEAKEKTYSFDLHLGILTDTLEPTGNILKQDENAKRTVAAVNEVLQIFKGEIEQVPPVFSAIKINGKRASDLALKGRDVKLNARKIIIQELSVNSLSQAPSSVHSIYCKCSKGTYIRSLARDIAEKLGTCGVAGNIRRLAIGDISVERASEKPILPNNLLNWEVINITEEESKKIQNGIPIPHIHKVQSTSHLPLATSQTIPFFLSNNEQIIAAAEFQNNYLLPMFML